MKLIPRMMLSLLLFAVALSTPAEKIKVLLVDGQNNHAWKQTSPKLKAILENSARFDVTVSTSPPKNAEKEAWDNWRPQFKNYHVVVSNYNGQEWPAPVKEAFEAYVKNGGGFVPVHAANNAFSKWAAYNEMIGLGGWGGRNEKSGPYLRLRDGKFTEDTTPGRGGSHGSQHEFKMVTRAPDHPIMKGLPNEWLHAKDELYDRLRGPAKNITVLASAFSEKNTRGSGEHEPLLMVIKYGKGRVFHTALGHGVVSIHGLGFQHTLLRGTEWAATGKVTFPSVSADQLPASGKAAMRDPEDIKPVAAGRSDIPVAGKVKAADGWVTIFDGKSLKGWSQKNGTAKYVVENGVITGTTNEGSPNSFMCSDKEYTNFELVFEVKVDNRLNSGVQIRSISDKKIKNGRVHGPQVEIEAGPGEAGHIYSEGTGRGWLSPEDHRNDPVKRKAFNNDQWNHYYVKANGSKIETWVNGIKVGEIDDAKSSQKGFIGLQVHGIKRGTGPYSVSWRNIAVRELK